MTTAGTTFMAFAQKIKMYKRRLLECLLVVVIVHLMAPSTLASLCIFQARAPESKAAARGPDFSFMLLLLPWLRRSWAHGPGRVCRSSGLQGFAVLALRFASANVAFGLKVGPLTSLASLLGL